MVSFFKMKQIAKESWKEKMVLPSLTFNELTRLGLPLDISYEVDDLRCQLYRGVHGQPAIQMPNRKA